MTKRQGKSGRIDIKAVLAEDEEFLRTLVRMALQEVLEAEMTEALGAEKGERASGRQGYRSGYYGRTLITRVGKLELRVPQDRTGRFSTELFERYQRSERALVAALAEMYVQGVSTRKVKAITEELCGHSFSASSISAMNQRLDASLAQFAGRPLAEALPYLILDARYERVREAGVITSQAVLIAIGIDWDGRRQVLAVELANRESRSSWRDFLLALKARGLHGVEFVVADDRGGGILDCRCARRSANRQVGTKGWSYPIEQRDANFDLSSAAPPPITDLLNFAHTTRTVAARGHGLRLGGDIPPTRDRGHRRHAIMEAELARSVLDRASTVLG